MRILAVSDKVLERLYRPDVAREFPRVDLIVGCGDLPYYYLEFLTSAFDARMIYVHGNHDVGPQYTVDGRVLTHAQGGTNIHGRVVQIDELLIAGLEGSMRYRPNASLMYSDNEMTVEAARLFPRLMWNRQRYGRALDILVTHSPPLGIHDRPDIAHTGFRIFRWMMAYFQPRYLLHGHIHVYRRDVRRVTRFNNTYVINVYPYRLLEFNQPPELEEEIDGVL